MNAPPAGALYAEDPPTPELLELERAARQAQADHQPPPPPPAAAQSTTPG